MATLAFDGTDDRIRFTPVSSQLANLPNGAASIAVLISRPASGDGDVCGLRNSGDSDWFHGLICPRNADPSDIDSGDDDGMVAIASNSFAPDIPAGTTGDDFFIAGVSWPAGGAALERFHLTQKISAAESWQHVNSLANNGGNRAGPGTTGRFYLGHFAAGASPFFTGNIALVAVWAGTQLSDSDFEALWINKATSDWCDHAAGTPTFLVECTSTSPTDIGANPSTFSAALGGISAAGADPTGWTFDGCGAPPADTGLAWIRA